MTIGQVLKLQMSSTSCVSLEELDDGSVTQAHSTCTPSSLLLPIGGVMPDLLCPCTSTPQCQVSLSDLAVCSAPKVHSDTRQGVCKVWDSMMGRVACTLMEGEVEEWCCRMSIPFMLNHHNSKAQARPP